MMNNIYDESNPLFWEADEATFDKGELKLTMPKVEAAKAKHIAVKAA
jgi:hypothetical protein